MKHIQISFIAAMLFASAVPCFGQSDSSPTVVSPAMFGGLPNDGVDDTLALQRTINHIANKGGRMVLASGVYEISQTLELGGIMGLRITGQGIVLQSFNLTGDGQAKLSKPAAFTAITWKGPDGGTMIRYAGSGGVIDGLSLWGNRRAAVGFQLYFSKGVASGNTRFPALSISGCDVAFRCGTFAEESHCADLDFGFFNVSQSKIGFQVNNNQGVNYTFAHANFSDTEVLFDFNYGGIFNCNFIHAVRADTILRIGHPGSGNGLYRIGMISLDAQQAQLPRLVDQTSWGPARISIESAKLDASTPPRDEALIRLYGQAICTLSNAAYLRGKLYEVTAGNKPFRKVNLRLENCVLDGPPTGEKTGPFRLRINHCVDTKGNEISSTSEPTYD